MVGVAGEAEARSRRRRRRERARARSACARSLHRAGRRPRHPGWCWRAGTGPGSISSATASSACLMRMSGSSASARSGERRCRPCWSACAAASAGRPSGWCGLQRQLQEASPLLALERCEQRRQYRLVAVGERSEPCRPAGRARRGWRRPARPPAAARMGAIRSREAPAAKRAVASGSARSGTTKRMRRPRSGGARARGGARASRRAAGRCGAGSSPCSAASARAIEAGSSGSRPGRICRADQRVAQPAASRGDGAARSSRTAVVALEQRERCRHDELVCLRQSGAPAAVQSSAACGCVSSRRSRPSGRG